MEAKNRQNEERIYWRWVLYSTIAPEPLSLEEYKKALRPVINKSAKLILKEQEELLALFANGSKKVEL